MSRKIKYVMNCGCKHLKSKLIKLGPKDKKNPNALICPDCQETISHKESICAVKGCSRTVRTKTRRGKLRQKCPYCDNKPKKIKDLPVTYIMECGCVLHEDEVVTIRIKTINNNLSPRRSCLEHEKQVAERHTNCLGCGILLVSDPGGNVWEMCGKCRDNARADQIAKASEKYRKKKAKGRIEVYRVGDDPWIDKIFKRVFNPQKVTA